MCEPEEELRKDTDQEVGPKEKKTGQHAQVKAASNRENKVKSEGKHVLAVEKRFESPPCCEEAC